MNEKKYQSLLKECPPWDSPLFINFIRANNKVLYENNYWIVIENIKYHTEESKFYTAFIKKLKSRFTEISDTEFLSLGEIVLKENLNNYFKYENDKENKSIKRYHIHFAQHRNKVIKIFLN